LSKCETCGEKLVEGAKFCIICGATVQKEPRQNKTKAADEKEKKKAGKEMDGKEELCASCNVPLRAGASFCVSCGTPVKKTGKQTEQEVLEVLESYLGTAEAKESTGQTEESPVGEDLEEVKEKSKEVAGSAGESGRPAREKVMDEEAPVSTDGAEREGDQEEPKLADDWTIVTGEKPVGEAEEMGLLTANKSVVSKLVFPETYRGNRAILNGKVKCHECNKLSIFSLEATRGWGGSNDPVTCPCGKGIEIGEYWSDSDNVIYVWASLVEGDSEDKECPLSITVNKVMEI